MSATITNLHHERYLALASISGLRRVMDISAPGRSAYPRYFVTPIGRRVSPKRMGEALRIMRANPDGEYAGWNWFPTSGAAIIRDVRRGIDDRINMRARRTAEQGRAAE